MSTTIYKKCERCTARCCSNAVSPVFLKTSDVTRIGRSNLTGKTSAETGRYEFQLTKKADGKCVFYRDDISSHCSIYDTRPDNCSNYNVKECALRELE